MKITIDVGNSQTKLARFDANGLIEIESFPTRPGMTTSLGGLSFKGLEAVGICSVVPAVNDELNAFFSDEFGVESFWCTPDFDWPFTVRLKSPETVGADRLANVMGAVKKHPGSAIILDMGTFLTADVYLESQGFVGGVIFPGYELCAQVSHQRSAKLPEFDLAKPAFVVGDETQAALQAGHYHGYLSLVEGLVARIKKEQGAELPVLATGGLVDHFYKDFTFQVTWDRALTLEGILFAMEEK